MKLTKTFEVERDKVGRIPSYFATQGYKLEKRSPETFLFKRGSGWAAVYTFDVRKLPTTVTVTLTDRGDDRVLILVNYNVSGKGLQIFTSGDREKIEAEMESLEVFMKVK